MQAKMGSKPCCETKSISAKEQAKDHELYMVILGVKAPVEPMVFYQEVPELILPQQPERKLFAESSPPLTKDISLLNRVFRI